MSKGFKKLVEDETQKQKLESTAITRLRLSTTELKSLRMLDIPIIVPGGETFAIPRPRKPFEPSLDSIISKYLKENAGVNAQANDSAALMTQAKNLSNKESTWKETSERLGNIDYFFTGQAARNTKGLKAETYKLQRLQQASNMMSEATSKQTEWREWKQWALDKPDFAEYKERCLEAHQTELAEYAPSLANWERQKEEWEKTSMQIQHEKNIKLFLNTRKGQEAQKWAKHSNALAIWNNAVTIPLTLATYGLIWIVLGPIRTKFYRAPFGPLFARIYGLNNFYQCKPQLDANGQFLDLGE